MGRRTLVVVSMIVALSPACSPPSDPGEGRCDCPAFEAAALDVDVFGTGGATEPAGSFNEGGDVIATAIRQPAPESDIAELYAELRTKLSAAGYEVEERGGWLVSTVDDLQFGVIVDEVGTLVSLRSPADGRNAERADLRAAEAVADLIALLES